MTIEVVGEEEAVEGEPHGRDPRRVVRIDNKDSGDTIRLRVPTSEIVGAVIDAIYTEFRLTREPDDRLTCRRDGIDVYQYAALTLEDYLQAGHCRDLHWSFASDTGGA
jgi:hypothetical protein